MKKFFSEFFEGCYGFRGTDKLTRFLLLIAALSFIVSITSYYLSFMYYVAFVVLLYCYFRLFSKNLSKRYEENQRFLKVCRKLDSLFRKPRR